MKAFAWFCIMFVIFFLISFIAGRVLFYPRAIPSHVSKIEVQLEQDYVVYRLSRFPIKIQVARRDLAFAEALSPEDTPEKYVILNQLVRKCKETVHEFNDFSNQGLPEKFCEPYMKDNEV